MTSHSIISTHRLPEKAVNILREKGIPIIYPEKKDIDRKKWVLDNIKDKTILIAGFMNIDKEIIDEAKNLHLIIARSSGYDHIDVEYAEKNGICVANQPEMITWAVTEHTLGLIFSSLKKIVWGHQYNISGGWYKRESPGKARGYLLKGKTIGIVGLGRIGSLLAYNLRFLGAGKILYWSRRRKQELELILQLDPAHLERVFQEADIVIVTLPKTKETIGIITKDLLLKMKSPSLLVNIGRGDTIVEEDLLYALKEKEDLYVALDVYSEEPIPKEHPLLQIAKNNDRLVLTPHNAGATKESLEETAVLVARQALHYIESGCVWNPVTITCSICKDIRNYW